MTGLQVPEGLAQWLFDQAYKKVGLNGRSRLWDAWKIVRFWERVAPFLDDDTIRLAEAAADVAEVLPDGWRVEAEDELVSCYRPVGRVTAFIHYRIDGGWWAGPDTHALHASAAGGADSPVDAARAALAALSGDPTDG